MATYGNQVLPTIGGVLQVAADGEPVRVANGVTVDWATVTAAASAITYNDGVAVAVGEKALRYGQILTKITATGKYGPYDTGASDGRQTLARGNVKIVNTTIKENSVGVATDYPDVIEGGLVFKPRLLAGGAGTATVPTYAAIEAVLPLLRYVEI